MSVLIKGIEMPNNCVECRLSYVDFNNVDGIGIRRCVISGWMVSGKIEKDKRMNDCPLVEVKTPHGRLIDAQETAEKHCIDWCRKMPNCEEDCAVYDTFRYAPTIIEAEEK